MDEERLPQKSFNWMRTGRSKWGRPKTRWKEGVLRGVEECGLRGGVWRRDFVGDCVLWDVMCRRTNTYIHTYIHTYQYIKLKQSRYTPWRRLGGEEV
jgi:hypothetical protein